MPYKDPEKRRQYQRDYRARKKLEKQAAAKAAESAQQKYTCEVNRRKRLKRYDLTMEEYETLLRKQRFRCKCCGVHQDIELRSFAVDHDHKTKQVRGLLCGRCNRGIGLLGDSLDSLRKAVVYLESHYNATEQRRARPHQRI